MNSKHPDDRINALEKLLVGLLDGIDGYESEVGDLHPYWKPEAVNAARAYVDALAPVHDA